MLSNSHVESFGSGEPELLQPLAENARVKAIANKIRTAKDENGKPVSKVKMYQFRDGLFEAMAHRFAIDPTMAAWGEENLSLIHISEPTRLGMISYAVFCL